MTLPHTGTDGKGYLHISFVPNSNKCEGITSRTRAVIGFAKGRLSQLSCNKHLTRSVLYNIRPSRMSRQQRSKYAGGERKTGRPDRQARDLMANARELRRALEAWELKRKRLGLE